MLGCGAELAGTELHCLISAVHAELVLSELGSGQNATGAATAGRQAGDSQTAQGVQQQLNKLQVSRESVWLLHTACMTAAEADILMK